MFLIAGIYMGIGGGVEAFYRPIKNMKISDDKGGMLEDRVFTYKGQQYTFCDYYTAFPFILSFGYCAHINQNWTLYSELYAGGLGV